MTRLRARLDEEFGTAEAELRRSFETEAERILVEVANIAEAEFQQRLSVLSSELQQDKNRQLADATREVTSSLLSPSVRVTPSPSLPPCLPASLPLSLSLLWPPSFPVLLAALSGVALIACADVVAPSCACVSIDVDVHMCVCIVQVTHNVDARVAQARQKMIEDHRLALTTVRHDLSRKQDMVLAQVCV